MVSYNEANNMHILDILTHPNPFLRHPCASVTEFDDKLQQLVENMFNTMLHFQGIGLAAPQVGILQRIIILEFKNKRMALINPHIIAAQGECSKEEGCLSVPGMNIMIKRADKIEVEAQNLKGEKIYYKKSGMLARIIQHETDHLNGILIIDKCENKILC